MKSSFLGLKKSKPSSGLIITGRRIIIAFTAAPPVGIIRYRINKYISLIGPVNHLANTKYFTRRADGYPGPGIIPQYQELLCTSRNKPVIVSSAFFTLSIYNERINQATLS